MPLGYLPLPIVIAWCTLCAVAPRRWRLVSGYRRYVFALPVNEVPCVAAYLLVLLTVLTAATGGIDTPVGWLGVALTALTFVGLAVIVARQLRAASTLTAAMQAGLRSPITIAPAVREVLLVPKRARRSDIERVSDVSYGDAGIENTLDLYRLRDRIPARPVLIHLHGGAFRTGRKNHEGLPLIYGLAHRGWLCISANYRLAPAATFPDPLIDVKKIIAWVRTHGSEYGADPDTIFVSGGSAGAALASLAALTPNEAPYQPGFEVIDTTTTGSIALCGIYGPSSVRGVDPDWDGLACNHLNPEAPPFLVVHGDMDSMLAVEGARDFSRQLRAVSSQPVVYAELPGAQHTFDLYRSVRADCLLDAVDQFTSRVVDGL